MEILEKKIREFSKEILGLKTSQPLGSNMKSFYSTLTINYPGDGKNHEYEITYADGGQPILTSIYSSTTNMFVLLRPNGNTQRLIDSRTYAIEVNSSVTILSSRQILGVRKIS
jgi:hypothetical protein